MDGFGIRIAEGYIRKLEDFDGWNWEKNNICVIIFMVLIIYLYVLLIFWNYFFNILVNIISKDKILIDIK
jgi:hypothetical protein